MFRFRKSDKKQVPATGFLSCLVLLGLCFSHPALAGDADEYLKQGDELYRTYHLAPGRLARAIQLYEMALDLRPDDYEILWKLSRMHQMYGETLDDRQRKRKIALWKKGTAYGKRAVKANPNSTEAHFYYMSNMGSIARLQGTLSSLWRFRKIKKEMDKTLELNPDFPPALVARAQYLTEMPSIFGGDEKEAMSLYKRALELDPGYLIAYYYLARMEAKQNHYDEAIAWLDHIIHCPEEYRSGNWASIDLPLSRALLKEILQKKKAMNKP